MRLNHRIVVLFLISLSFCLLLNFFLSCQLQSQAAAANRDISYQKTKLDSRQQTLQGTTYYRQGKYTQAIEVWLNALQKPSHATDIAILHTYLASAYRKIGLTSQAIEHWSEAIRIYQHRNGIDSRRRLALAEIDQAQAYNDLGQPQEAIHALESAIPIVQQQKDGKSETVAHNALGNAYLLAGNYNRAFNAYQDGLNLATTSNSPVSVVIALNGQAKTLYQRSQQSLLQAASAHEQENALEERLLLNSAHQDQQTVVRLLTQAIDKSKIVGGIHQAKTLIGAMDLLRQLSSIDHNAIASYSLQAFEILKSLPDSRDKAYTLVALEDQIEQNDWKNRISILELAITVANHIGDNRAKSFALGAAGQVYESVGQLPVALDLTHRAQLVAEQANAADSLYRWQWQAGRIYAATGHSSQAISAYEQAVTTLQSIRGDLIAANKTLQLNIRDQVEPVYRELLALLLDERANPENIKEALKISGLLQLSQLQTYFNDECLEVSPPVTEKDTLNSNEAVINSIILDRKAYSVLRLPSGVKTFLIPIGSQELQREVEHFRSLVENRASNRYLLESQKLYDLLFRPMETELAAARPSVLVFISDGILRNLPWGALHDGKRFLIEKYPIANALDLNLNANAKKQRDRSALVFGLTSGLPNVAAETKAVQQILGGKRYLNQNFTLERLTDQIEKGDYPVVHLATHGAFGGTATSTYLQAFDGRISLTDFETALSQRSNSIDLLTLSACDTAAGDNRSVLGFAGLSVRAGVKSVLGSLWAVNDADTVSLIEDFYRRLNQPGMSKAEALRSAKLRVIQDQNSHPADWSGFTLVGDWH